RRTRACTPAPAGDRIQRVRSDGARASLSRRGLSQHDLADATRQLDQLGGRDHRHRALGDLQRAQASPLPMVLVGLLVSVFLLFEARRYRYFNVWRARCRLLETDFFAPMISGEGVRFDSGWTALLAKDYREPRYHISLTRAIGRRLRRTYGWIFVIQAIAYYGKLAIHPVPLHSLAELWDRAAIGPVPGTLVIAAGVIFHGGWAVFALVTWQIEVAARRDRRSIISMG